MAETVAELEARLAKVNAAIDSVLTGGVSRSEPDFSFVRAGLPDLMRLRDQLAQQIADAQGGRIVIGDYGGSSEGWA